MPNGRVALRAAGKRTGALAKRFRIILWESGFTHAGFIRSHRRANAHGISFAQRRLFADAAAFFCHAAGRAAAGADDFAGLDVARRAAQMAHANVRGADSRHAADDSAADFLFFPRTGAGKEHLGQRRAGTLHRGGHRLYHQLRLLFFRNLSRRHSGHSAGAGGGRAGAGHDGNDRAFLPFPIRAAAVRHFAVEAYTLASLFLFA